MHDVRLRHLEVLLKEFRNEYDLDPEVRERIAVLLLVIHNRRRETKVSAHGEEKE